MTPFGFTPGNSDDSNEPVDFAAMMQQMQQQIQEQFSKLGINPGGFGGSTEALPKNLVRDTAKKFATAQGSAPIGANDVSDVEQEIITEEAAIKKPVSDYSSINALVESLNSRQKSAKQ